MKNNKIWITVNEFAKKNDVSLQRVYEWIRQGRIDSARKYGRILINEDAEKPRKLRPGELSSLNKAALKRECRFGSDEYIQKQTTGIAAALRRSRG